MWWQFFANLLISTLLQELLRPKQHFDKPKAAGLGDFSFPTASEDRAIPVLWGTAKIVSPNTLWYGNLVTREITRSVRSGMFSKDTVTIGYKYYLGMQLGLCCDGVDNILEVWAGEAKAWSGTVSGNSTITLNGKWKEGDLDSGLSGVMQFYSGSTVQDAYLSSQVTVNPNFKHMTYAVFKGPASGSNNGFVGVSPNIRTIEIVARRLPKVQAYGVTAADYNAHSAVGTYDANIAFCILEALCNPEWGAGIPPDLLDLPSFVACAARLKTEGNGCSLLWDNPRPITDIVSEMAKQANATLTVDLRTGLLKFDLIREDDAPVFAFDESNILRVENFSQATADEATNQVRLSFKDIAAGFKDRAAVSQDLGGIEMAGQIIPATVQYPGVSNPTLAIALVNRDLQAVASSLAKCTVRAYIPPGSYVHPGELVTVTWPKLGLNQLPMRALRVRYSDSGKGEVQLDLVQDTFRSASASLYAASVPPIGSGNNSGSGALPGTVNGRNISGARFIPAPYGITRDDADHAMFIAFAPDANTTGYDLAFSNWTGWDGYSTFDTSAVEYLERRNLSFGALGTLAAAMPDITAGSVTINLASGLSQAGNAATLRRFGSQSCLAFIGLEVVQVSGITVNAAGTQATFTVTRRGLYDSDPTAKAVGAEVVIVCDYGLDPQRVRTIIYGEPGKVHEAHDGQTTLYALAEGRNSNGYAGFGTPAAWGTDYDWGNNGSPPGDGLRACLPYSPGNIKLGGVYGSSNQNSPAALSLGSATSASLTWANRNRLSGGLCEWATTGDGSAEDGVFPYVRAESWNGSSWVALTSGGYTSDKTITQQTIPMPGTSQRPALVRVMVQAYKPIGYSGYGMYNRTGTGGWWYFTVS